MSAGRGRESVSRRGHPEAILWSGFEDLGKELDRIAAEGGRYVYEFDHVDGAFSTFDRPNVRGQLAKATR